MRALRQGREIALAVADLADAAARADGVLVDLGTGDGEFPYRFARQRPGWLAIGVDAAAENMARTASRIGRKPARGGVDNLILLVAPAEALPDALEGIADRVTVNFPWGSLLLGVATGDPVFTGALARLAKPGARLDLWLNLHVFDDEVLRRSLTLPEFDAGFVDAVLAPAYAAAGFALTERTFHPSGAALPVRTTWGQRLSRGSRRPTVHIAAERR